MEDYLSNHRFHLKPQLWNKSNRTKKSICIYIKYRNSKILPFSPRRSSKHYSIVQRMYSINPETYRQWHICYLAFIPCRTSRNTIHQHEFFSIPGNKKLGLQQPSRSAGWRGSSPRRGPDDATPRFFRPSSAVFFGKFDTPVCQLFWHVSPLRPSRKRDERRGADTRVPAIYSASRLVNDMRVVQSDIGTGERE